ncbi:uncharacterized protein KGF55_005627 [Candida pseudojiufengensis]|uniref:uncharacterized protein n=1 Tax=Candida pseudojiufengensis TaxID=497109 RepID=UPI00222549E1|nr:uncharacterized protein KGF55_005627 [Candida pseudojiufengensis]KAI5958973.1 hypothetical protein KGF55_005627 [Candida pseudojiufengensis]
MNNQEQGQNQENPQPKDRINLISGLDDLAARSEQAYQEQKKTRVHNDISRHEVKENKTNPLDSPAFNVFREMKQEVLIKFLNEYQSKLQDLYEVNVLNKEDKSKLNTPDNLEQGPSKKSNQPKDDGVKTEPSKCSVCDTTFGKYHHHLMNHILKKPICLLNHILKPNDLNEVINPPLKSNKTIEEAMAESTKPIPLIKRNEYCCYKCKEEMPNPNELQTHIEKHHLPNNYKCPDCRSILTYKKTTHESCAANIKRKLDFCQKFTELSILLLLLINNLTENDTDLDSWLKNEASNCFKGPSEPHIDKVLQIIGKNNHNESNLSLKIATNIYSTLSYGVRNADVKLDSIEDTFKKGTKKSSRQSRKRNRGNSLKADGNGALAKKR